MKDGDAHRVRSTSHERPTVRAPSGVDFFEEVASGLRSKADVDPEGDAGPSSLEAAYSVRDMLEPPEDVFFASLDERVRRSQMMRVLLKTGALSRPTAGRALQAQLEAVRRGALALGAPQLVALLEVLGAVVGELAQVPERELARAARDVVVLDEDEVGRDLVALAIESEGHAVRCASTFDELLALCGERRPDVVISDAELRKAPARIFCPTLRDALGDVPVLLFATRADDEVFAAARAADIRYCVPKEVGIGALIANLATSFETSPIEGG